MKDNIRLQSGEMGGCSPPFEPFLLGASSSIILQRSKASQHKTELTSTTLCNNAAPPEHSQRCASLDTLQGSCTNGSALPRQASQPLVINPVVQDEAQYNAGQLQRTRHWKLLFNILTLIMSVNKVGQ